MLMAEFEGETSGSYWSWLNKNRNKLNVLIHSIVNYLSNNTDFI